MSGIFRAFGKTSIALLLCFAPLTVSAEGIPLEKVGGVYEVPVEVNGVITLNFILDTGAAEVFIPAEVALTLIRTQTVRQEDFLPGKTYTLADGSTVKSPRLIIAKMKIGRHELWNVPASISGPGSPLLLGQSLLERIGSWTIDNQKRILVLGDKISDEELISRRMDATEKTGPDLSTPTGAIRTFFESLANEQFDVTWASLSTYSQNEFIRRVAQATEMEPTRVKALFDKNPTDLKDSFWSSFRESSGIRSLPPSTTYRVVEETEGIAVVEIVSGKLNLKSLAYKEGEEWRFGYIETLR